MPEFFTQLELAHPWRLAALAVLPLLAYFAWRSPLGGATWRRVVSASCRSAIVALLVAAVAGPVLRKTTQRQLVVFVTDVSKSTDGASRKSAAEYVRRALAHRGTHEVRFLSFAKTPGAVRSERSATTESIDSSASDPAAAVLLAAAAIPPDYVGRIVLLTDGAETDGRLLDAACGAGVPISVVPLAAFSEPEVSVADIQVPPRVQRGRPFPVDVVIASNHDDKGDWRIYWSTNGMMNERVEYKEVKIKRGRTRVRFNVGADSTNRNNRVLVEVELQGRSGADACRENNRRSVLVPVGPPPRVLLVGDRSESAKMVFDVLRGEGFDVSTQSPRTLRLAADDFKKPAPYDLIILSGVSAGDVQPAQLDALDRYVRDCGVGLIAVGGKKTFGPDVYRGTTLERMLPVRALARVAERKKSLAMVLVVDKSASMAKERRIELAKQAAQKAVQLLDKQDQVGMIAFGDDAEWVIELSPCDDKPALVRQIGTLGTSGQTNMYPALERAYFALKQADADQRWVILLTDGVSSPGDFRRLARRMADAGIFVSTVSLGKGADQTILKEIADIAGRHQHCDNPEQLEGILERETTQAIAATGSRQVEPLVFRRLPGLDVAGAPPLSDYAPTSPKAGVELLLTTGEGDPLLSWWRHGEGIVAAMTSDAGDRWRAWSGYRKFWARIADHAIRKPRADNVVVRATRSTDSVTVTLDAAGPDGQFINGARARVTLFGPRNQETEENLEQVAPGRYQGRVAVGDRGPRVAAARIEGAATAGRREVFGLGADYAEELRLAPAREDLLRSVARQTGGACRPDAASVLRADGRSVRRVVSLWSYLVLVAAWLLVADVGVRRWRVAG